MPFRLTVLDGGLHCIDWLGSADVVATLRHLVERGGWLGQVRWEQVDIDAQGERGAVVPEPELHLPGARSVRGG